MFSQPPQYPDQGYYAEPEVKADNEEVIEAIIEEKWNELMRDINRIIEWKNKTETKINSLDQQFKDLKDNFDNDLGLCFYHFGYSLAWVCIFYLFL